MSHMNSAIGRGRSATPSASWTRQDASELYEIARWGKGYFSVGANGHVLVHPTKDPEPRDRSQAAGRSPAAARHRPADADPLPRHPEATASATSTTPSSPRSRSTTTSGSYVCVYPIKVNQQRQVVEEVLQFGRPYSSASRPAPSRSCWRSRRSPTTTRRSSATASRTPSSSRWRCWPRRSGARIIPVVEKYTELGLILEYAEKVGVRPTHRHAREAGGARRRALAVVGRLSLEVRAHRHRDRAAASRS